MKESDGADEFKLDRTMELVNILGIRLDNIKTGWSVCSLIPVSPSRNECVFAEPNNEGQGLTMSSMDDGSRIN